MVLLTTARAMDDDIDPRLNWTRKLTRARTTYCTETVEKEFEHYQLARIRSEICICDAPFLLLYVWCV